MIEDFIPAIPDSLLKKPGGVFYSGRNAFSGQKDLYILGLNPGGTSEEGKFVTIQEKINDVLINKKDDWSEYRDESWEGAEPGTWRMQPRILHLLANLNFNPGETPSSNIIFMQSRREKDINSQLTQLADECWPFHSAVIEKLRPKVILCFGKKAGIYVAKRLSANKLIDEFVEQNNRHWRSQVFIGSKDIKVVVATHPSIADWTSPNTDPSNMIIKAFSSHA